MSKQRNILTGGLSLALRNWPAFVWTYFFNLGLAVLFTLPFHAQIKAITAHSLASQRLMGAFDLGALVGVAMKLGQGPGAAVMPSYFATPFYLLLYFLIVPGALLCYQTGTPARLFTLLKSGFDHFWRFVRITLVTLVIAVPILGALNALKSLWSAHIDLNTVGRRAFLLNLAALVLIGLIAAALRLYFDLMQVYTIQLGQQSFPAVPGKKSRPERQIRRAFKPAWGAFRSHFFRAYATFVFLAFLGLSAVVFTARMAMHSLAQPRMWPMFLLAQLGLFLMLFTRFWQRGAETILALDNPLPAPPIFVADAVAPAIAPLDPVLSEPILPDTSSAEAVPAEVEGQPINHHPTGDESEFSI